MSSIPNDDLETITAKRVKFDDVQLENFTDWCSDNKIVIDFQKVSIGKIGSRHNYGMVALTDLDANQILARIPKSAILEPGTCGLKDFIKLNSKDLKTESNWSKLIISIMYEMNNPQSNWAPYLKLFPNYDLLDLPMFWTEPCLNMLEQTCVFRNIQIDLAKMRKEFDSVILPFVQKHKQHFNESCFEFEHYKKITAFIMAYSFRDQNEEPGSPKSIGPMMVPVADILNHVTKNNAQLQFEKNELIISTTKPIKKGEEIFNTYGEHSNTDLLHMYGFVEKPLENSFDSVEIPIKCLIECYKKVNNNTEALMETKIETLKTLDIIDDNTSFLIGTDGVLNEEECLHMLQIYSMSKDEFNEFIENNYELLEDEEWDNYSLVNDKIHGLPIDWKILLNECCVSHLDCLKLELQKIQDQTANELNKNRVQIATHLIEGHINLLNEFIKSLKL